MEPKPEVDERAFASAMREIEVLAGARRGTPQAERLQVLVAYVVAWQSQHPPADVIASRAAHPREEPANDD